MFNHSLPCKNTVIGIQNELRPRFLQFELKKR